MAPRQSTGIVYIDPAYDAPPTKREALVEAEWEIGDRSVPGPGWEDVDDAVAWGRMRAPEVHVQVDQAVFAYQYVRADGLLVRLEAPVEHRRTLYSAGHCAEPRPGKLLWPSSASDDARVAEGYGGTVWIAQREVDPVGDDLGFVARHEGIDDRAFRLLETVGPAWLASLDRAIAWARARAPVVLVSSGPPLFEYWSAGETSLPTLDLPEWPLSGAFDTTKPHDAADVGSGTRVPSQLPAGRTFPLRPSSADA